MVDFNSDQTIGTPARDVETITILQRRFEFIEAYEDYKKKRFMGANWSNAIVRARLISLFIQLYGILKRRMTEEEFNNFRENVFNSKEEKDILECMYYISDLLDKLNITKIDNIRAYDRTNAEAENLAKGY